MVSDPGSTHVRVEALGGLRIVRGEREAPELRQHRTLAALLVYLAVERRVARDALMATFWPESDTEKARHALRQALYRLRQVLGSSTWLRVEADELIADASLSCDVGDFDAALAASDRAAAAAFYRGPFLQSVHLADSQPWEQWCDAQRLRLAPAYRQHCRAWVDACLREDDLAAALAAALSWVAPDPSDDEAQHRLIELLVRSGDRAGAMQQYEAYARLLSADGLVPLEETTALYSGVQGRQVNGAEAITAASASISAAPYGLKSTRRTRLSTPSIAAAAVVLVVAAALLFLRSGSDPVPTQVVTTDDAGRAAPQSVAVLRFRNIGGDSADQYFSDGMAEEVMHALARVEGLQVAARSASFLLPADSLDPREIGRRLRVATVLEGSVRRAGDLLRVSVRLVNATNGYTLWQESYDRSVTDAFRVQEEVAHSVAAALRIELQPADALRTRRTIPDFETYDLYLRGRYIWWTTSTEDGVQRSIAHFRRALARDSTFAQAWVGLADALLELTSSHHVTPATVVAPARDALLRAVALDPHLADAHASLGYLATFHDHRWQDAEASFLRALALDARHANARLWLAWLLTARGRHDEAVAQIRQAQAYEPLSRLLGARLATMLYFARNYEGCIRQASISIEADSTFWLPYRQLGEALVQVGRPVDALSPMRRAVALSPTAENRARHAYALARAGDIAAAREILADLASEGGDVSPVEVARVYTALGENDRALLFLERGAELGSSALVLVGVEPAFDPLRGSPRFHRIVRRLDL
ncbi:hypothetical protein BH23GEM3_BH23GEM3_00330 [soil metagenome]